MKRWLAGIATFLAAFFVARLLILQFGQPFSGFGFKLPARASNQPTPVKISNLVTALPPLTNLAFRTQPPAANKPDTNSQSNEVPADASPPSTVQSENQNPLPSSLAAESASTDPNRRDPMARVALSMVGIDSAAEEYWVSAINDPTLSEKEREDLIEDLNEVGFNDPRNPTAADIPLILNRLQLIETYAPSAMDDTNARSFAEAYKDLSNMLTLLNGQ